MNVTTVKCPLTNEMITTHHVRHIFMPIDQTNNEIFMQHYILLNIAFQSHPTNHGCCKQTKTCLIVATFHPLHHRPCVHFGRFFKVLIA